MFPVVSFAWMSVTDLLLFGVFVIALILVVLKPF